MKIKVIIGIIIPIIVIVSLTLLGSLDIGFSVSENFIKKLTLEDISNNEKIRNSVNIGEVIIQNDYFLSKRYDLPLRQACLVDNENVKQGIQAGAIRYSEGDPNQARGDDILNIASEYGYNNYYQSSEAKSVEIKSNEKKLIYLFLLPSYEFNYKNISQLLEQYSEYDELLIFNQGNNHNYNCYDIPLNIRNNAIKISLR